MDTSREGSEDSQKSSDLDEEMVGGGAQDTKISHIAMLGGIREGLREHALAPTPVRGYSLAIEQEAEIA